MENGCCNQFIRCLWHSFLLRGRTPHALSWHGSFKLAEVLNKLPQCGSIPWGAVLQEHASVWVSTGHPFPLVCFLWAPTSSGVGLHRLQADSAPAGIFMGCRARAASLWPAPQAASESLFWRLRHLFPLLHWPWCLQICFYHRFSLLSGCNCFCAVTAFFFLINYHRAAVTIIDGLSSRSIFEEDGHGESSSSFPPPKPSHHLEAIYHQSFSSQTPQPPFLTSTFP